MKKLAIVYTSFMTSLIVTLGLNLLLAKKEAPAGQIKFSSIQWNSSSRVVVYRDVETIEAEAFAKRILNR